MVKLGLAMIVKNEAAVIRRCLDSVRALIDHAIIIDTGSNDGTQEIVRHWLADAGVAGSVLERPWHDFATNRNECLAAIRSVPDVDYVLTLDADEVLVLDKDFDVAAFKRGLGSADAWRVLSHAGPYRFRRHQLFSNRLAFAYRYVRHER